MGIIFAVIIGYVGYFVYMSIEIIAVVVVFAFLVVIAIGIKNAMDGNQEIISPEEKKAQAEARLSKETK